MQSTFLLVYVYGILSMISNRVSTQLLSQSVTTFETYARPGVSPGGSLLSFAEILRQRSEGSTVKQCPCVILPGSNRCIAYDSRFQAASLEEAILTFVDTSMSPSLFDDHLGPPLAASSFTCTTPACRHCAGLLAARVRQLGITTTTPSFGFSVPKDNELDPKLCRRLRLSRSVPARIPPATVAGYMKETIKSASNFLEQTRDNAPKSDFAHSVDAVIALSNQFKGKSFAEAVLSQTSTPAATAAARNGNANTVVTPSGIDTTNVNPVTRPQNPPRWPTNMPAPVVRPLLKRVQTRTQNQPQGVQSMPQGSQQIRQPTQAQRPTVFQQQGQQFVQSPQGMQQQGQQFLQQPQLIPQQFQPQQFVQQPQQGQQFVQQQAQSFPQSQPQFGFQQPSQSQQFVQQPQTPFFGQSLPQNNFPQSLQQAGMFGVQEPLASIAHQGVESAVSNFAQNAMPQPSFPGFNGGGASAGGSFGNGNNNNGNNFGIGIGRFGRKKRAADSSRILGNRFIISCVERGDSENDETDYINLCTACWTWRQLPADYFPRLINELVCNENDFCLSGFGACHQRYRNVDVLHRGPNGWQPTTISVAACCDCKVRAGTEGHSLVVGSRNSV